MFGEARLSALPRPATTHLKAIKAQRPGWQPDLDLVIFTAAVPERRGEVFPFQVQQGWSQTMRKAWVVPTRPLPPIDGTASLVLVGTPGEPIPVTGCCTPIWKARRSFCQLHGWHTGFMHLGANLVHGGGHSHACHLQMSCARVEQERQAMLASHVAHQRRSPLRSSSISGQLA